MSVSRKFYGIRTSKVRENGPIIFLASHLGWCSHLPEIPFPLLPPPMKNRGIAPGVGARQDDSGILSKSLYGLFTMHGTGTGTGRWTYRELDWLNRKQWVFVFVPFYVVLHFAFVKCLNRCTMLKHLVRSLCPLLCMGMYPVNFL